VNGVKLGVGDEVVGAEILPADGDVFVVASDGKAKRIVQKDFPTQGRYGRGVILWDLPLGAKLAGLAVGKGTRVITLHLLKAAPKMTRLDEAGMKKRAATRGDTVVEVKPGDAVLGLTDAWIVDRFITVLSKDAKAKKKEKEIEIEKAPETKQLELLKMPKGSKPKAGEKKEGKSEKGKAVAEKKPAAKPSAAKKPAAKSKASSTTGTSSSQRKKPTASKKPAAKPTPKKPAAKK
jgi:hypothetical protein